MNIFKKTMTSIALVSAMMVTPVMSADTWGSAGLTSDYFFRGASQNGHSPAAQVMFGASSDRFYGGVWASQVDFENDASIEYDFWAGMELIERENFSLDLGVIQYNYDNVVDSVEEVFVTAGYKVLNVAYYKDRDNSDSTYTEVGLQLPFISFADVSLEYGKFGLGGNTANITFSKNFSDSLVGSLKVMKGAFESEGISRDNVALAIHYNF